MMAHACSPQLLRRLRQENCLNPRDRGCCELRSCHCTSVQAIEWDSISNKKKQKKITDEEYWRADTHLEKLKCNRKDSIAKQSFSLLHSQGVVINNVLFLFLHVLILLLTFMCKCGHEVAHINSRSTLGGQGGRMAWGQEFKTSLGNIRRTISTKINALPGHGDACL